MGADTRTAGRPVLVTGANSGVGRATVLALAARGYRAVGSVRSAAKADAVLADAAAAGVTVETVLLDVTDERGCTDVVSQLSPLLGLVNNAGYGGVGAVEDVDDDEVRHRFETMVFGPMRLARLALPGMRSAGGGRIVNVSSIYGRTTTPLSGWYQATKHALEAVSDALRMEVAADGIHVSLVQPGGIRTEIWEDLEADVERHAESRYASAYARSRFYTRFWQRFMIDPDRAADAVVSAITARAPRARYLVGLDARTLALTEQLVPTRVRDRVSRLLLDL